MVLKLHTIYYTLRAHVSFSLPSIILVTCFVKVAAIGSVSAVVAKPVTNANIKNICSHFLEVDFDNVDFQYAEETVRWSSGHRGSCVPCA
jgi:hypothetical protein